MKFNIEGFDSMTVEEQLTALKDAVEAYNPEENGFVAKTTFDKAASQTSDYKKQMREAQAAAKSADDHSKDLEARIAELEKIGKISEAKTKYLSLGYADDLATSSAVALVNGDTDALFANQKTFYETMQKQIRTDNLNGMVQPASGNPNTGVDYDKLISDAQDRGAFSEVAYYTRLKESASNNS